MDPILIDEWLSPYLTGLAGARSKVHGYIAMHVAWINREGSDDRALAMLAAERDDIIATNNRRDLLRIYTQLEVHNGLIIIVPTAPAEEQCRLFDVALDTVERQDSLINLLIEVHPYGTEDVRNWSKDQPEQGA